MMNLTRRRALLSSVILFSSSSTHAAYREGAILNIVSGLQEIEKRNGGRLGILMLDTGSNLEIPYRAEERFPMCSTFKFLAAAAILKRVDDGKERLDRQISYGEKDLDHYAPVTKSHLNEGSMALSSLCEAAIVWSDNTAANLLLTALGGPGGITSYARSLGDNVTRLDRTEPTLNTAIPGDERDTTSPRAILQDMKAILLGSALSQTSRSQLEAWLIASKTGAKRLRAGVPPSWRVGDKTGTGENGTTNTIAIMIPPGKSPILATVYYTGSIASPEDRDASHSEIARIFSEALDTIN